MRVVEPLCGPYLSFGPEGGQLCSTFCAWWEPIFFSSSPRRSDARFTHDRGLERCVGVSKLKKKVLLSFFLSSLSPSSELQASILVLSS